MGGYLTQAVHSGKQSVFNLDAYRDFVISRLLYLKDLEISRRNLSIWTLFTGSIFNRLQDPIYASLNVIGS